MRSEKHCLDLFYYYKRKKTEKSKSQAWKWRLVCMHATIKHVDVYLACAVALECICVFSFLMMLCCCSTPSIFVKFNVFFSTSSQFRQNCKFSQLQHIRRNSYLRIQLAPKMTNFAMSSCHDTSMRLWLYLAINVMALIDDFLLLSNGYVIHSHLNEGLVREKTDLGRTLNGEIKARKSGEGKN